MRAKASAAPARATFGHLEQGLPGPGCLAGAVGGTARHRQHGALDRSHHRLTSELVGDDQGSGEILGARRPASDIQALGEAPQQLGEDDPGVATSTHERPMGDGPADGVEIRPGAQLGELGDHTLEGEGHVGPRVSVGYRIRR